MSYIKAADVLPVEVIEIIQKYVDGEYIYVPRKEDNRKSWGEKTRSKELILRRNQEIYKKYKKGMSIQQLAESYYLSPKTIQKIIAKFKLGNQ
jgi:Mor family transcriptional regulator